MTIGALITIPDSGGKQLQMPPPMNEGADLLQDRMERIFAWIPTGVEKQQFIMACATEANKQPEDVNPASVVKAAFNCAVIGLVPGEALGHAFFISRKLRGVPHCSVETGYKGFLELAYGSGFLKSVHCEVVLKSNGEKFRRWNDENGPRMEHELPIDRVLDYNNVLGAYCIWKGVAGGSGIQFVDRKALDKVNTKRNVWKSDPIAMVLKTPLRRAAKLWKMTGRMAQAVTLDDLASVNKPQPSLPGPEGTVIDAAPPKPSLASMGEPSPGVKEMEEVSGSGPQTVSASDHTTPNLPTEASVEAASNASQLLAEYQGEFKRHGQGGIQADVDALLDSAERDVAAGNLPDSAMKEIQQSYSWATEALKTPKGELFQS